MSLKFQEFSFFRDILNHVYVCMLSHVQLFATPWMVALQAPQSIGFSRQESWYGLSFLPLGDLPDSGIKLASFASPVLSRKILYPVCHLEMDPRPCLSLSTFLLFPWIFTLILKNLILNCFFLIFLDDFYSFLLTTAYVFSLLKPITLYFPFTLSKETKMFSKLKNIMSSIVTVAFWISEMDMHFFIKTNIDYWKQNIAEIDFG